VSSTTSAAKGQSKTNDASFRNPQSPIRILPSLLHYLPILWLLGAPLTFTLLTTGLIGAERLRRHCTYLTSGPAYEACQRLASSLRLSRQVALAACDSLAQPLLVGILRPLILLPAAALTAWTPAELEMVLLHELAHVRRWDNLVNLLQRLVESLLFFHPAVWLVSRQVRRDREDCCDALVVAHTKRPEAYATLLLTIASTPRSRLRDLLTTNPALASAMANHPLQSRIRRILKLPEEPMRVTRRTLVAVLALPLLAISAMVYTAAADDAENPPPSKGTASEAETSTTTKTEAILNAPSTTTFPSASDNKGTTIESGATAPTPIKQTKIETRQSSRDVLTPKQRKQLQGLAQPGDIPAAVMPFPVSPDEVALRVKELNALGHNIRVANSDDFTVLFIVAAHPGAADVPGPTRTENGPSPNQKEPDAQVEAQQNNWPLVKQLNREIASLEDQVVTAKKEVVDLEAIMQLAGQQTHPDAATLGAAIEIEAQKDQTLADFNKKLADLNQQLQQLTGSSNADQDKVKQLNAQIEKLNQERAIYGIKLQHQLRDKLQKIPDDAWRQALAEHELRLEATTKKLKDLETQIAIRNDQILHLAPPKPPEAAAQTADLPLPHENLATAVHDAPKTTIAGVRSVQKFPPNADPKAIQEFIDHQKASGLQILQQKHEDGSITIVAGDRVVTWQAGVPAGLFLSPQDQTKADRA
jgi:beta-lactamase regulating signal transducer with metallopeptidase domain